MLLRIGRVRARVRWAKALAAAATLAFWVLPSFAQTGAAAPAASTAPLRVTLNHAGVVTFDGSAATALIADPNVADIVTERGNVLFILGRSIGTTNLLVYDGSGHRLVEREVVVVPDEVGVVTVTRDIYENDYFCTPRCVSPPPPTPLAGASATSAPAAGASSGPSPFSGPPVGGTPVPSAPATSGIP
jgi:Pilus formation protein N terminal region